ncbi:MAG: macro domain-containing protein, partial [Prochlorothrix sp.]
LGLKAECRQIGHCDPGQAVLTNAYRLPAQWVIHTVGPRWNGGQQQEEEVLQSCYERCIDLAEQNGAKTLTFPAISTGALGCPLAWAVDVAVRSVSRALQTSSVEQITFVCFDPVTLEAYQDYLETPSLV